MDDSLQKIMAASHPCFSRFLFHYGRFTPEDAGRQKGIRGLSEKFVDTNELH